MNNLGIKALNMKAESYSKLINYLEESLENSIVGKQELIRKILTAIIANRALLVKGNPNLGKTLIVKSISRIIGCNYAKITFTEDLCEEDLIISEEDFEKPIFYSNILFVRDFNLAPKKIQAKLFNSIKDKEVNIRGLEYKMPSPYIALCSLNPDNPEIEKSKNDEFIYELNFKYPNKYEEMEILERKSNPNLEEIKQVISKKQLQALQRFVVGIHIEDDVKEYIVESMEKLRNSGVEHVLSPISTWDLTLAAKVNAIVEKRGYVKKEDINLVAKDILFHRIFSKDKEKIINQIFH